MATIKSLTQDQRIQDKRDRVERLARRLKRANSQMTITDFARGCGTPGITTTLAREILEELELTNVIEYTGKRGRNAC